MTTRSRYVGGRLTFFDSVTFETVGQLAPVSFYEDFMGNALTNWGTRTSGSGAAALSSSTPSGAASLTLAVTSEVEVAGLDFADQLPFILNQNLIFESRFRLSVLPTGAVIAAAGVCSAFNAAADSVTTSAWFRADGSGAITVETDDNSANETSKVATGITLAAGDWMVGRIDMTDPTSVKFFINGARVAQSTTFNMNTTPAVALQPIVRIGKETATTSVGTMLVDYLRLAQNRS